MISLCVNLVKGACDSEPESLCLTFDSAAVKVSLDVERCGGSGKLEGLLCDVAESILFEVLFEGAAVDGEIAFTSA